ncbi:MAG: NAD(P)H-dependent oxidoreductase [Parvibaculaceae bacterium]|nr:NAD(P)H-dependent oxidoreductase [Parvibaculaceae bacterium]
MASYNIAVIAGSLRKESYNRRLAQALIGLAPERLKPELVEIGDLPLFNQDHEKSPALAVSTFKAKIKSADAVLFVTPEYNRSIPGVLKNALDTGSRPYGESAWLHKPAAIAGTSPGAMSSALAQQHLRNVLTALDMPTMPQPEVFIHFAEGLISPGGTVSNEGTAKFLRSFLDAFVKWIERNR